MDEKPYAPPPEPPSTAPKNPVPIYLVVVLGVIVVLFTYMGMFSRPSTLLSPTPFLSVVATKVVGLSVPILALLYGASFAATQFRHFIARPNEILSVFGTLALSVMTLVAVLYFVVDVPLGLVERGAPYTAFAVSINVLFCVTAWFFWYRARRPGNYFSQVFFGFTVHSWLAWCYLPNLGVA